MINKKIFLNGETKLQALYTNLDSTQEILFIHGMGGNANTWDFDLQKYRALKAVAPSLRGRGESDSPLQGYSYDHHLSDLLACANEFDLKNPVVVANSAGVAWAIGLALKYPVKALILIDHAAIQIPISEEWVIQVKKDPEPPFNSDCLKGLIAEFNFMNLFPELPNLKMPIKLLVGGQSGSHITDEDIEDYKTFAKDIEFIELPNSAHGITEEDEELFWDVINEQLFA